MVIKLTEESKHLYGHDQTLIDNYLRLSPNDTFLDIGCGPGTWSLAAASMGARVFAMDPRPLSLHLLAQQVVLNGFHKVSLHPYAAWSGVAYLPFSDESSSFWGKQICSVPAISIDELLWMYGKPSINFINIDAEGAEDSVLDGATSTITNCRPDMVIEIHPNIDVEGFMKKVKALLPSSHVRMDGGHLIATSSR
jgi:FkbM family methyltransferase